jgi:hypothetical protein
MEMNLKVDVIGLRIRLYGLTRPRDRSNIWRERRGGDLILSAALNADIFYGNHCCRWNIMRINNINAIWRILLIKLVSYRNPRYL